MFFFGILISYSGNIRKQKINFFSFDDKIFSFLSYFFIVLIYKN